MQCWGSFLLDRLNRQSFLLLGCREESSVDLFLICFRKFLNQTKTFSPSQDSGLLSLLIWKMSCMLSLLHEPPILSLRGIVYVGSIVCVWLCAFEWSKSVEKQINLFSFTQHTFLWVYYDSPHDHGADSETLTTLKGYVAFSKTSKCSQTKRLWHH